MTTAVLLSSRFVVLAAMAAGVAAYAISHAAFRQTVVTTDENSYIFQARTFLQGRLKRPCPPLAGIFRHEHVILDEKRAGWVSRYPPGHSLWLAPGVLLGQPHLMSAIGAALALFWMSSSAARLGGSPAVVALFACCSPFFLFTYGTLLSHTSGLTAAAFMLWAYIRWRQTGAIRYAVAAGLGWSVLFLNRTYTGLLIAVPFGLHALVGILRDRRKQALLGAAAFAAAAAAGALVLLAYNYAILGDPFTMTYLHWDPSEGLGFGPRHVHGKVVHHTLWHGCRQLGENIRLFDRWLFGFQGSLLALSALVVIGWNAGWSPLLAGSTALIWLGYVCFWYPGPRDMGPGYYFESLPYIFVAGSLGISQLWAWLGRFPGVRRAAAIAAAGCLALASASFAFRAVPQLQRQFGPRIRLRAALRTAPPDAMVFVEADRETSRAVCFNPLGADSRPLLFWRLDGTSKAAIRRFPDRKPFSLRSSGAPRLTAVDTVPAYDTAMQGEKLHRRTGGNENGTRMARQGAHPPGWLALGRSRYVFPGRFVVHYDISVARGGDEETVGHVDVVADDGARVLARKDLRGSVRSDGETIAFEADGFHLIEPRVYYSGRGDVTLRSIRILEAAPP
ncbi:MAG: hypothetical protein QME60_04375 [Verrucomicrobiota bacterium]|nr:hypothetical protein [Verrucomicrobiota bacterium]